MKAETYTVTVGGLRFDIGGIITDALTGITYAVSRDGHLRVALNVPLCACCDEPVEQCTCLAPVVRVSEHRVAA